MTLTKQGAFTKKVTDLPNTPSPNITPADIKSYFQTPSDELAVTHNALVDDLTADTAAGLLGAKDGAGATSTVQAQLDSLNTNKATTTSLTSATNRISTNETNITNLQNNKTDKTGDHLGTWHGFTPSQADPGISSVVDSHTAQLADMAQDVKLKYGAIGDGTFHKIRDVFPYAVLADIQTLNPSATIDSSADWYALQTAINSNRDVFVPEGSFLTDLPLVAPANKNTNITGVFGKTFIYNSGVGTHAYIANGRLTLKNINQQGTSATGSGIFISASYCVIENCEFDGNGGYGIEYTTSAHVVFARTSHTTVYGNKLGGIYCVTNTTYQKTAIKFDKCYVAGNGNAIDANTAQTSGGNGFYLGACLGVSVMNTVCEYNHGAGIYIANEGNYGVFGVNAIGCYFEGNRYANVFLNNADTSLAYKDIFIKGNYYSAYPAVGPTYYTNSRLNESIRVIIQNDNIATLTNSTIEEKHYGFESNGVRTSQGGILTADTRLKTQRIGNLYNDNEANIQFGAGAFVDRNIGDANPVLVARNNHGSFTGNLFEVRNGASTRFSIPVSGKYMNLTQSNTPSSSTAAGATGDICWDANYIYVCVATNTWKRTTLASW